MKPAPMRYTKIEGTAVAVSVKSATEAKAAVRELRHKKRELNFERKRLVRRRRALLPERASRGAGTRGRRTKTSIISRVVDGLGGMIAGLFNHAVPASAGQRSLAAAEIEREIRRIDETLENIEGCILQLQGKLLTHGATQ